MRTRLLGRNDAPTVIPDGAERRSGIQDTFATAALIGVVSGFRVSLRSPGMTEEEKPLARNDGRRETARPE